MNSHIRLIKLFPKLKKLNMNIQGYKNHIELENLSQLKDLESVTIDNS